MIRTTLALYIGACATLVLIVQALSAFHLISVGPLIAGIALVVVPTLCVLVARRPRVARPRLNGDAAALAGHPLALPFVFVLPTMILILFALGWHMPPNNWDAMTYHLSRAAYWRQWHSLAHYPTNNLRQDVFPGNAEVLLLVTLLLAHSARIAFIVQCSAYLASLLAIYGIGRELRLQRVYALVGAGAFATMPEVVLQSTSAQNDLVVAAFVICAVYFLVDVVQKGHAGSIVLAGTSLGLAVGTKPTAVLALPGLGIGAIALVWSSYRARRLKRAQLLAIPVAMLIAAVLGAPWYVANRIEYGHFSGPPEVTAIQDVAHPSLVTTGVNMARYMVSLVDPAGPALLNPQTGTLACFGATTLRARMVEAVHLPMVEPAIEWPGVAYSPAPACEFNEDVTWFGVAGWLAVMAALVWLVTGIATRKPGLQWLLAAGSASFLICASLFLRWQPWEGRLLITAMALSAPLLGVLASGLSRYRLVRPLLFLAVLYMAGSGLSATIDNGSKPLSAWSAGRAAIQVITRPEMGPILARVARTVLAGARLGVFLNGDDWDFPLFGEHLDRTVEPLVLGRGNVSYPEGTPRFSYLLTHRSEADVGLLLRELRHVRCRLKWVMADGGSAVPFSLYDCAAA